MKYAIDRIKPGSEQEVSADSFYGKYIPQRLSRFFCPECGEQVYWRSKGGAQPNKFYHQTRTESSPECDKRVDGRSELYVYERVGLPLYLSIIGNTYQLNLGFPPISEEALQKAFSQKISIKVSSNEHSRSIPVNPTDFLSNATTLIPINFVPSYGENYKVVVEGGYWYNRKWADYADGFASGGAIFAFDETGGKKIRRGDSISLSKKYWVVTKRLVSYYSDVVYTPVGSIQLNGEEYKVFTMTVNIASSDDSRYSVINNYFKSTYGVWLLETLPEVIPLWPPVVERDAMIPTTRSTSLFCSVSSGNTEPAVYTYNGNMASNVPVYTDSASNHTIKLMQYSSETVVSVDRKYVGREVMIHSKAIPRFDYQYHFSLLRENGTVLDLHELQAADFRSPLIITSNAKNDLVLINTDYTCSRMVVRESSVVIPPRSGAKILLFTVENSVVLSGKVNIPHLSNENTEAKLLDTLSKYQYGIMVPAPYWIRLLLSRWREQHYNKVVTYVERHICNGKLQIGLVQVMTELLSQ